MMLDRHGHLTLRTLRRRRVLSAVGALMMLLGLGNYFIGRHQSIRYREKLVEVLADMPADKRAALSRPPTENVDLQIQHINRLTASVQFFELVESGGVFFLSTAAVLLALYAFWRPLERESSLAVSTSDKTLRE